MTTNKKQDYHFDSLSRLLDLFPIIPFFFVLPLPRLFSSLDEDDEEDPELEEAELDEEDELELLLDEDEDDYLFFFFFFLCSFSSYIIKPSLLLSDIASSYF